MKRCKKVESIVGNLASVAKAMEDRTVRKGKFSVWPRSWVEKVQGLIQDREVGMQVDGGVLVESSRGLEQHDRRIVYQLQIWQVEGI
jgi:hypothetical protein